MKEKIIKFEMDKVSSVDLDTPLDWDWAEFLLSKSDQIIDIGVLEDCTREVLDKCAPRAFAIMDPLKITISNWEEEKEEEKTVLLLIQRLQL